MKVNFWTVSGALWIGIGIAILSSNSTPLGILVGTACVLLPIPVLFLENRKQEGFSDG